MSSSEDDEILPQQDAQYNDLDLVARSQPLSDTAALSDHLLSSQNSAFKGASLQGQTSRGPQSSQSKDEEATEASRPNKYRGPRSNWLRWTAADREIAASLDRLQARDLSVHLYNTHALRLRARRLRDDSQFERRGRGKGKAKLKAEAWEPPKTWAAWPLPIAEVPREVSNCGLDVVGGDGPRSSREDLEEIMVGVATRIARERWEAREWESAEGESLEQRSSRDSDASMESASPQAEEQASSPSPRAISNHLTETAGEGSLGSGPQDRSPVSDESAALLRPVPLADDDTAAALLLPSIQHTLTHNLDRLLYALHRTRASYAAPDAPLSDDSSRSSRASSAPSRSMSRRSGRVGARSVTPAPEPAASRGRKRKRTESVEAESAAGGESREEAAGDSGSQTSLPSTISTWGSSRSRLSSASARAGKKRRARLGLRDWSDVLGLAALQGWDREAFERTRKRCAELFQENMDFVSLDISDVADSMGEQSEERDQDESEGSEGSGSRAKEESSSQRTGDGDGSSESA